MAAAQEEKREKRKKKNKKIKKRKEEEEEREKKSFCVRPGSNPGPCRCSACIMSKTLGLGGGSRLTGCSSRDG